MDGYLKLEYDYDERRTPYLDRFRRNEFEETLRLESESYIYHPRLLDLDVTLELGTLQENISEGPEDTGTNHFTFLQYDLLGRVLKEHPWSLEFFAGQERDYLPRSFSGSYRQDLTRWGGEVLRKSRNWPVSLRFVRNESETQGLTQERWFRSSSLSANTRHSLLLSRRLQSTTDLQSVFQDREETFGDEGYETESVYLYLSNHLLFSRKEREHALRSSLRYQNETGDLPQRVLWWTEDLDLELGRALTAGSSLDVRDQDIRGLSLQDWYARVWAQHLLYASLTTTLQLDQRYTDFEQGEETQRGGRLDFFYRRQLSDETRLFARTGVGRTAVNNDARQSIRPVLDERITLQETVPSFLEATDVIPSSILVRSASRDILYREGFDYRISQQGEHTEILRIPTGLIEEGQTVSVDYRIRVQTNVDYDIHHQSWLAGAAFLRNRLIATLKANRLNYTLQEGDPEEFSLEDRSRYSALLQGNFLPWGFEMEGYYLDRETATERGVTENASYLYSPLPSLSLLLSVRHGYSLINRAGDDEDDSDQFLRMIAQLRNRFSPRLSLASAAEYGRRWGDFEDTEDWQLSTDFSWRLSQLEMLFGGEYREDRFEDRVSRALHFYVRLIRKLF